MKNKSILAIIIFIMICLFATVVNAAPSSFYWNSDPNTWCVYSSRTYVT